MIFKQYYLNCLAHASYLIGDDSTHTAVVIDPQRDVDQYIEDAQESKLSHIVTRTSSPDTSSFGIEQEPESILGRGPRQSSSSHR